jgi:iron(III) transport system substrate-binding protein
MTVHRRWQHLMCGAAAITLIMGLAAAPASAQNAWDAEGFDLDALIEAARAEPPITVYDSTGKIV